MMSGLQYGDEMKRSSRNFRKNNVIWRNNVFQSKPKGEQRLIIQHVTVFPVIASHLAAIKIQALARGYLQRRKKSKSLKDHDRAKGFQARDALFAKYLAQTSSATNRKTVVSRNDAQFHAWIKQRIVKAWRGRHVRRHYMQQRHLIYHRAQCSIARQWRRHSTYIDLTEKVPRNRTLAAIRIQNAWRSFTQKRIYTYFKGLVYLRQNSNPQAVLKALSPQEGALLDKASGMYLRFRLGGTKFPPLIYYKIYTSRNVTDLGAFAPRDYQKERTNFKGLNQYNPHHKHHASMEEKLEEEKKKYWYRREENNGWRPITDKSLVDPNSEEAVEYQKPALWSKEQPYHHSKLVRQVDMLKKRKRKKLQWIKKMYSMGAEEEKDSDNPYTKIAEQLMSIDDTGDDVFNVDWEDEADELLQWTSNLDYERYQDNWFSTGTTKPLDQYLDDQDAEIADQLNEMSFAGEEESVMYSDEDQSFEYQDTRQVFAETLEQHQPGQVVGGYI